MAKHNRKPRKTTDRVISLPHNVDAIRHVIESTRGKLGRVAFIKKDGSPRALVFQRGNDEAYVLGTERGERASATFKRNNPAMLRLRDHRLVAQGQAAPWRTVNLETVYSTRVDGVTIRWE
jgi:hypothetical protein